MLSNKSYPLRRWSALEYAPNEWALEHVHSRPERFIAGVTTRQCGKTFTAAVEIDEGLIEPTDELHGAPVVGVLAPTYEKAELAVERYFTVVRKAFGVDYVKVNRNKHQAVLKHNGAVLTWMSAEQPDSVLGLTLSKLIIDEGQNVSDEVYNKAFPTTNVRRAPIRAFGTPDVNTDQSWFRGMWLRGQDEDEEYHSFTLSCYENPWITEQEILDAMENMSDREFRMLMLGQWVDAEGAVFRDVEQALIPANPTYRPEQQHVMAVDFAMQDDYTVIMVAEVATKRVIYADRWNKTPAAITYERIYSAWEKFGRPRLIADASGMGLPMVEDLRRMGIRARGVVITAQNKMAMVQRLSSAIEHARIRFIPWEPLLNEFKGFILQKTPSGRITAAAAAGFHDDAIMCLVLLNEGLQSAASTMQQYNYAHKENDILSIAPSRMRENLVRV